jgi:DNA-binding NarL/FixJ family response regulator
MRILVADGQPMVRFALRVLLERQPDHQFASKGDPPGCLLTTIDCASLGSAARADRTEQP